MTERGKAIFEQLFEGKTAQVLDHLTETRPFDFDGDELAKIHSMTYTEVFNILSHLQSFKLVKTFQKVNITHYTLADNKKTENLIKFYHEVMMDFLNDSLEDNES